MFIINLTYISKIEEVEKYLIEHKEYLDKFYDKGNFLFSGRKNPRNGGIIICKGNNKSEVEEIISKDPFWINKIARYDIIEFEASKYANGLELYI
ncbi:MAG: YciI family protein [Sarcina sp.]